MTSRRRVDSVAFAGQEVERHLAPVTESLPLALAGHATLTLIGLLENLKRLRAVLADSPDMAATLAPELNAASAALASALRQLQSELLLPPVDLV